MNKTETHNDNVDALISVNSEFLNAYFTETKASSNLFYTQIWDSSSGCALFIYRGGKYNIYWEICSILEFLTYF